MLVKPSLDDLPYAPLAEERATYRQLVVRESENGSAEIRVGRRPAMAPMTVRMMKEPKRARRIRDLERMKAKCRRVYPRDTKAKQANHLAVCSSFCCGNQRRYEGAPTRELRWAPFACFGPLFD